MSPAHGTYAGYSSGCRCNGCRRANAMYHQEQRRKRRETDPDAIPHGASGYSNYLCRCDTCRTANTERARLYMAGRRGGVES